MTAELPDGWRWVKLGDVCEIVNGSTPKSSVEEYWGGNVCWITPTDLGSLDGAAIERCARPITQSGYDSCSTTIVPIGSVVMSSRAPIGHLGIARTELCTNQGCKSFVPRENIATEFLYYSLKNSLGEIRALGSGATFTEVSKSKLEQFAVLLPPLDEQRRIVNQLETQLAAAQRAQRAAQAQLDALDALPAALLREIFPRSPAARLPRGWRWVKLGDVCEINPRRPKQLSLSPEDMITFIPMAAVSERSASIVDAKVRPFSEVKRGYTYMEHGDVIFAKIDACMRNGKHAIVRDTRNGIAFGSTEFHVLRPSKYLNGQLLHRFLLQPSLLGEALRNCKGTAQRRLPKEFLSQRAFPLPPFDEQRRIIQRLETQLEAVERAQRAAQAQFDTLSALPAAMLRLVFPVR